MADSFRLAQGQARSLKKASCFFELSSRSLYIYWKEITVSGADFKYMDAEEKELIESIENLEAEELKPAKPDIKKTIERAAMEYHSVRWKNPFT